MKKRAHTAEASPHYPTFKQARSARTSLLAGLSALLVAPVAGCLEATPADQTEAQDASWTTGGVALPPDASQPDAGEVDAGTPADAGQSPAGDVAVEDGGI